MAKSTDNLIRLVKAGGNLSIDAEGMSTDNIIRVVNVAIEKGKNITFRNLSSHSTDNLLKIIKAGGSNVVLEV